VSGAARNSRVLRQLLSEATRGRAVLIHGAVHDHVIRDHEPVPLRQAVLPLLSETLGYQHVGWYDLASGLRFHGSDGDRRANALDERCRPQPPAPAPAPEPAAVGANGSDERARVALDDLRSNMTESVLLGELAPQDAIAAVARLLDQRHESVAVVVEGAGALFDPASFPEAPFMTAQLLHALDRPTSDRDPDNLLVLITEDLDRVPSALRSHARIALAPVAAPDYAERLAALRARGRRFHGANGLDDDERAAATAELAVLMDGESLLALRALERTSLVGQVGLDQPARLVQRARRGVERDAWQSLTVETVGGMRDRLSRHVSGQDAAIDEVVDRFTAAWVGIRSSPSGPVATRPPRLTLMLVGGTGVGKTELAKAIAREVFGDEGAVIRQDMSEFKSAHDAARLGGAPPGYVGHDAGGELTERVRRRPFSVVLLDEIEKAHATIWDRLLQVLDEGRLTDGRGNTADFGDTILLLTSNLGTRSLGDLPAEEDGAPSHATIRAHCVAEVARFMSGPTSEDCLGRPELYGRLEDDILVFDILRQPAVREIVHKTVGWWAANAASERGLVVRVDPDELVPAIVGELGKPGSWHGRTIRNSVKRRLERPIARHYLALRPAAGARGVVRFDAHGRAELVLDS
jgi:hypothetical protein